MVVFEDKRWTRQKKRVPKNGPKNGLRKDSKNYNFGTHVRGTKMGQLLDLNNGPTQPKTSRYFAYVYASQALLVPPIRKYGPQKMDPKMDPNLGIKTY